MSSLATISLPFTALKFLYKSIRGDKIVCEIDMDLLKKVNEPSTIDEMVAEAKLEYAMGKSKTFSSAEDLIKELHS